MDWQLFIADKKLNSKGFIRIVKFHSKLFRNVCVYKRPSTKFSLGPTSAKGGTGWNSA